LAAYRSERAILAAKIATANAVANKRRDLPSRQEIESLIADLGKVLEWAAGSQDEAELGAVMRVMVVLTGGRMRNSLFQIVQSNRRWNGTSSALHEQKKMDQVNS